MECHVYGSLYAKKAASALPQRATSPKSLPVSTDFFGGQVRPMRDTTRTRERTHRYKAIHRLTGTDPCPRPAFCCGLQTGACQCRSIAYPSGLCMYRGLHRWPSLQVCAEKCSQIHADLTLRACVRPTVSLKQSPAWPLCYLTAVHPPCQALPALRLSQCSTRPVRGGLLIALASRSYRSREARQNRAAGMSCAQRSPQQLESHPAQETTEPASADHRGRQPHRSLSVLPCPCLCYTEQLKQDEEDEEESEESEQVQEQKLQAQLQQQREARERALQQAQQQQQAAPAAAATTSKQQQQTSAPPPPPPPAQAGPSSQGGSEALLSTTAASEATLLLGRPKVPLEPEDPLVTEVYTEEEVIHYKVRGCMAVC